MTNIHDSYDVPPRLERAAAEMLRSCARLAVSGRVRKAQVLARRAAFLLDAVAASAEGEPTHD